MDWLQTEKKESCLLFLRKRFEVFSIYDFATILVFTAPLCQIPVECTAFQMNCKKLFLNALLYIIDLETLFRISFDTDSLYILFKKKVSLVLLLHFTIVCNIWLLSSGCRGALFVFCSSASLWVTRLLVIKKKKVSRRLTAAAF